MNPSEFVPGISFKINQPGVLAVEISIYLLGAFYSAAGTQVYFIEDDLTQRRATIRIDTDSFKPFTFVGGIELTGPKIYFKNLTLVSHETK